MKYRLFIDFEADSYLTEWAAKNKKFVLGCPPLASDFEVNFENVVQKLFLKNRKYGFHFSFKEDSVLLAKGKIEFTPDGVNDYSVSIELSPRVEVLGTEDKEILIRTIQGFSGTFLNANAFLMYGNILGEKDYAAAGRNEGSTKVITFRKHKNTVYAVHTSSHRSPEGVFSVRGHFRHYQSGKVVWIDEYVKGVDKNE